jgi:hypothetical protein
MQRSERYWRESKPSPRVRYCFRPPVAVGWSGDQSKCVFWESWRFAPRWTAARLSQKGARSQQRSKQMAARIDTFLKGSIAASVLIAAASIAYYYLHYLPQRDAQVDRILQMEQTRIEFSRQAEQARLIEEKRTVEERRAAEKEALQNAYQLCISNAEDNYSRNWADQMQKGCR